ncbi:MAG: hypothetical protein ACOYM9_19045 [Bradymonadia bacterium]|jgi:hypothetical protein
MSTPLQTVKARFGSKEELVQKLSSILERQGDESDKAFAERLLRVPNSKLLTLHDRAVTVKEKFGTREALADAVIRLRAGDSKDATAFASVRGHSPGRLLDTHKVLTRKAKAAAKAN